MTEFFVTIVNMSISAGWIVLAVLLLRLLLKKTPKWIIVLLWGIVAVRLICPVSIESAWSLIPSAQTINPEVALNPPIISSGVAVIDDIVNPVIGGASNKPFNHKGDLKFLQIHYAVFSSGMVYRHCCKFHIYGVQLYATKEENWHGCSF